MGSTLDEVGVDLPVIFLSWSSATGTSSDNTLPAKQVDVKHWPWSLKLFLRSLNLQDGSLCQAWLFIIFLISFCDLEAYARFLNENCVRVYCCCLCRFETVVAPFITFFREMTGSTFNATVDVYAPMFCCDFINFLIVVFGYQSFGPAVSIVWVCVCLCMCVCVCILHY